MRDRAPDVDLLQDRTPPGDCSCSITVGSALENYAPVQRYWVDVVVHIITTTVGVIDVSDEQVNNQIDVLNEDFQALSGTPGAPGSDTGIQFRLASFDPGGQPTNGITRTANDFWFQDQDDPNEGTYWDNLAWDPSRYLNLYSLAPQGDPTILGYVSLFPACGAAGTNVDRVVVTPLAIGRDTGFDPYDQGRTATHEVGHYFGLYHTFQSGCSGFDCYQSGDRICDTNKEEDPYFGCGAPPSTCGDEDPIHNYMDYSDDVCMWEFTPEQARRARCTALNFRSEVLTPILVAAPESGAFRAYALSQNRPNPFNPTTEIAFELRSASVVSLVILDVGGRIVRTLVSAPYAIGAHSVSWDGTDDVGSELASGLYFYRLETSEGTATRRMTLLK